MTTPELLQFIRIEHALGMSFNEIIQLLTAEGGWDRGDVSEAFSTLGLPEEAVELFFAKDKKVEVKPVSSVQNLENKSNNFSNNSKESLENLNAKPVQEKAKETYPIQSQSQPKTYIGQATPMHYVEGPEKIEKPTLARPASLSGQASRPLVRTLSNAISYAKVDKSKLGGHEGSVIHVSKLEDRNALSRHSAESYPAEVLALSREEEAAKKISEIEKNLSFGMNITKEEPKPKNIASPVSIDSSVDLSNVKPIKILAGGEVESADNFKAESPRAELPSVQNNETPEIYKPQTISPLMSAIKDANIKVIEEKNTPSPFNKNIFKGMELDTPPAPPSHNKLSDDLSEIKFEAPISLKEEPVVISKTEISNPSPIPQISHIPHIEEKVIENVEPAPIKIEEPVVIPKTEIKRPNPISEISHIPKVEEKVAKKIEAPKIIKEEPIVAPNIETASATSLVDTKISENVVKESVLNNDTPLILQEEKNSQTISPTIPPANITASTFEDFEKQKEIEKAKAAQIEEEKAREAEAVKTAKIEEEKAKQVEATKAMQVEVAKAMQAEFAKAMVAEVAKAVKTESSVANPVFTPPQTQYVQAPPQQVFVMPPQMYAPAQSQGQYIQQPTTSPPKSMVGTFPRVEEIGSTSPDLEEQAYLAQFGQAKMPEGLIRPQASMVVPTIIYAQQMVPEAPLAQKEIVEEKKPEPIRFDIGRLRVSHKTDQSVYSSRPTKPSLMSELSPVVSKTVEELFTSPESKLNSLDLNSSSRKDSSKSIKLPSKRTMESDLLNVQDGVVPTKNVIQSLSNTPTNDNFSPNTVAVLSSEEPIAPPPPKKSTKSILIISLISIGIVAVLSSLAYYLIVLRLPSGSEVYKNAVGVALRGPALVYDANLSVHAKSTDAEPEYIDVDLYASGTLSIRDKAFKDGIHEIKTKVSHMGISLPINFDFDGNISVQEDNIFVSQNSPSRGTKIENILKEKEIIKLSYRDIGKIINLSNEAIINGGDYGQISQDISLFKLATSDSPIITNGEIVKFKKDNKEFYKIPIKLDAKKAIKGGDMLSKYFRGGEAVTTGAERSSVLENRYNAIQGEIIVEKLSMKPISLSLLGKFDPSKIPLDGEFKLLINFSFSQQLPIVDIKAETYGEIAERRASESISAEIIRKDAPYVSIVPVLNLALNQYYEKIGRFPITLSDLVTAGFVNSEALNTTISNNLFYSSYVGKPIDLISGVRCQPKNTKCNFYHLGTNLEYRKAIELQSDADIISSTISGDDNTGCHKESGFACYDISLEK